MGNTTQKKINIILFVLLSLNICCTSYLIFKNNQANKTTTSAVIFENDVALKKLVAQAVTEYNNKNFKSMYSLFDDLARVQMNESDTIESFNKLNSFSGKIVDYVYSSSEKAGFQSGKNFYTVKYMAKFEGGTLGKSKGELKVTFADSGSDRKLFYFGANANLSN